LEAKCSDDDYHSEHVNSVLDNNVPAADDGGTSGNNIDTCMGSP